MTGLRAAPQAHARAGPEAQAGRMAGKAKGPQKPPPEGGDSGRGSGRRGDEEAQAEVSAVAESNRALHLLGKFYAESVPIPACLSTAISIIAFPPECKPPRFMTGQVC